MLRKILTGLSLFVPLAGAAQVRVDKLVFPPGTKYAEHYIVPVVSGVPTEVAGKINLAIQYSLLGLVPGHYRQPVFTEDDRLGGTTDLAFTVVRADSQVLTIDIEGSYLGAYSSVGHTWMSFDLHDGQIIAASDILTPAGIERSKKAVDKALLAGIRKTIAHPDALRTAPGSEDDLKTQRDAYASCARDLGNSNGDTGFELKEDLVVTRSCDFPHVILALDDLGEVAWKASYASLGDQLTPYGRCVLVEKGEHCARATVSPMAGVWRGTIGKGSAITFIAMDGGLTYFYDRIGTGISLRQQESPSGHWVLNRIDEKGSVAETFDLVAAPTAGFTGTWKQVGKDALPVVLR
ncbi:MAG: hypothetical protein ABWX83_07925 [Luteibacter sp.]